METNANNSEKYLQAKKQVEKIKAFRRNLTTYCVVVLSLAIINLNTYPEYLWFLWPLFWWGIGVVFHGMNVYNYIPFLGSNWEEKKINELMEDEKKSKQLESWK